MDVVTKYAEGVLTGRPVVSKWARLACERHVRDLESGVARGLVWDVAAVEHVTGFFREVLRLSGGEFEGKPFHLAPHHEFIVGSLFGWKRADGFRRYRNAYVLEGKGGGKSPVAAGIGLYGLTADSEPRAEVYSVAVDKSQASILFRDAVSMIRQSPALARYCTTSGGPGLEWNIAYVKGERLGFFRPIASESRGLGKSGLRPHINLFDELHEHRTPAMVDWMKANTKARRQALNFAITNAGVDRESVCYRQHVYSQKVLEGVIPNDAWFAFIAAVDDDDDPLKDETCWPKANPALYVKERREALLQYLREQVQEARGMPYRANTVLRLNFGRWTEQLDRWLEMDVWNHGATPFNAAELAGRECWAGLDLAPVRDLSALVLIFPPIEDGEPLHVVPYFWCPGDNITQRSHQDQVPYDRWRDDGHISATPGDCTDFRYIENTIKELAGQYHLREVNYDPVHAHQLAQNLLDAGIPMVPHRTGMLSMAGPTAELERLVLARQLRHAGHPVLTWNAANVTLRSDQHGNRMPDKQRSTERIDGITALVMALGGYTLRGKQTVGEPSIFSLE